jgi:glycerophosphoryl diester phosphodiesterase
MAEVDLQLSGDGHLVLFHDRSLGRTTRAAVSPRPAGSRRGHAVRLADLTLEEIKNLDAGSWFAPAFAGLAIPTLSELLEHCAGRLDLNLELKVAGTGPPAQAREHMAGELCGLLRTYPAPESLLISSLDHRILASVRKRDPRLRVGLLLEGTQGHAEVKAALRRATTLHAYSLHLPARLARPSVLAAVQQEGYRVYVYTVNQPSAMRRMIAGKVDGIMTDYPDRLTALLNRSRSPRP